MVNGNAGPQEGIMPVFAPMEPTTQLELHLAPRMSRLGTETAFEVLNKARALERHIDERLGEHSGIKGKYEEETARISSGSHNHSRKAPARVLSLLPLREKVRTRGESAWHPHPVLSRQTRGDR